ncbi:PIN domain-containing protein [Dactylosporangium sp. NPDC049525]|uniref:PIN domain-containing protein n=1 Tax=Dactylosporangium sp. NPDC049525 TaxID=3154730 RepID=UPI003427A18B
MKDLANKAANGRSSMRSMLLTNYIQWVHEAERQFRSLFADDEMVTRLHSPRHWHIRAHGHAEDLAVGPSAFYDEFEEQQRLLLEAADALSAFRVLAEREGEILVLDTNTLMHYQRFDQVKWREEFGVKAVRLLLPLVVLDEVDAKTYASSPQLARRAESVLRALDSLIEAATLGAASIRPGVTLEVLTDPDGHRRTTDKDDEILRRAEFVEQVVERRVTVVSADRGMRVRGIGRGLRVRPLPEALRVPLSLQEEVGPPAS